MALARDLKIAKPPRRLLRVGSGGNTSFHRKTSRDLHLPGRRQSWTPANWMKARTVAARSSALLHSIPPLSLMVARSRCPCTAAAQGGSCRWFPARVRRSDVLLAGSVAPGCGCGWQPVLCGQRRWSFPGPDPCPPSPNPPLTR